MARQVTVIGAGIIGMCTASYLQRSVVSVTVLDALAPGHELLLLLSDTATLGSPARRQPAA